MSNYPSVYVACLACYNDGSLTGAWFDGTECPTDMDQFNTELTERGLAFGRYHHIDGHEELAVHDHENYRGLITGEPSVRTALRVALAIEAIEKDGIDPAAVAAWLSDNGETLDEWDRPTREAFEGDFAGVYHSVEAYAWELLEGTGELADLPEWAQPHRGALVESYAADLEHSMTTVNCPEGGYYLFNQ